MEPYSPDPDTDSFRPPTISTLVGCLHCGEEYESYQIVWRDGFWRCPIQGCDGAGFGFDILPIDQDYVGEDGERMWVGGDDDEEDEDYDDIPPSHKNGKPQKTEPDDNEDIPY